MIDSISGILTAKQPTYAIVDVQGIRYRIHITVPTYEKLPGTNTTVTLLTYLHVREDILDLYGFYTESERDIFHLLIGISGIGPKLAITILSGTSPAEFRQKIIVGDIQALTVIPGIGPKTAKRMILELKDKFTSVSDKEFDEFFSESGSSDIIKDARDALLSLGYNRAQIQKAFKKIEKAGSLPDSLEELIKLALATIL
ncbi:MAG: Holliday junction branch migration protein RuvA [Fidelibacterota bacterium]